MKIKTMQDLEFINEVLRSHIVRMNAYLRIMVSCDAMGDTHGYDTAYMLLLDETAIAVVHAHENDVVVPCVAGNSLFH